MKPNESRSETSAVSATTSQINQLRKPSMLIILRDLQAFQGNNDEWIQ